VYHEEVNVPMRVVIAGGGVAGLATALACQRAGIDAEIYEAYDESAGLEAGAYLTVAVNGLDALRTIGAHERVMRAGFPTRTMRFMSGTGKHLGDLPIGGTLPDGTVTHTIKRSDLYSLLSDEVKRRGIAIRHGKKLTDAREVDDKVVVTFADGSEVTGDLLVGADGIHSRARQIIDPDASTPRYTGLGNIGGFARVDSIKLEPETFLMVWGKRAFFGATPSPDGEIWWFANPPSNHELSREELAGMSAKRWKERLVELFRVDRSPAVEIIQATKGRLVGTNQYDMPHVPTWRRSRMVIIGDAAHAAAPSSGQGVSMAVEDAVVLAKSLRESTDIPSALARFEAVRRPRVERVVEYGARFSGAKAPGTVSRIIRDLMLPFVFKRAANPTSMQSMSWLFDYHIDWEEPLPVAA
jgi:2-polyprenyl-6-methoxyphenol hydroxylase-like FAD-dependent oxidoreductase